MVVGFGVLSAYFGKKTLATSAEMLNSDFPEVAKVIVTIVVPGIAGNHLARKILRLVFFWPFLTI